MVQTAPMQDLGPEWRVPVRFVMQMAPPIFIILFGSMLEIVYRPRLAAGRYLEVTGRLLTRALQCYLLYLVTLVALMAVGRISVGYMLRCALMLGATPYADILKFYTLALAFAPMLLVIRARWGLIPLAVFSILVHLAHPLIIGVPHMPAVGGEDYFSPFLGFMAGIASQDVGGPSVLHGMTFVAWGMIIGYAVNLLLNGETDQEKHKGRSLLAAMVVVAFAVAARLWNWSDPFATLTGLSDLSLRNGNYPIYFALSCGVTIVSVLACVFLYDRRGVKLGLSLDFVGRTSLFTFSFGNVLLYLMPFRPEIPTFWAWVYTAALFLAICLQSYIFWSVQNPPGQTKQSTLGAALAAVIRNTGRVVSDLTRFPARIYSNWVRMA